MTPDEFSKLAALLHSRSGLVLGSDKGYLAESRLTPVARHWGFKDATALVQALLLKQGKGGQEDVLNQVVEAMTTNESFFFRDKTPFDQFRDTMLPALMEARKDRKSIRIWSAACSSGQEPYSLAMMIKELGAKLSGWRVEIVATDLSSAILRRAEEGQYSQFEVQRGLPIQLLAKYFDQEGDRWRLKQEVRRMVSFRKHNLLDEPRALGKFDVVFCRNVLIYFDQETKGRVLNKIADVLTPDGYLTLGGAETVLGISSRFRPVSGQRGLYEPTPPAGAAKAGSR